MALSLASRLAGTSLDNEGARHAVPLRVSGAPPRWPARGPSAEALRTALRRVSGVLGPRRQSDAQQIERHRCAGGRKRLACRPHRGPAAVQRTLGPRRRRRQDSVAPLAGAARGERTRHASPWGGPPRRDGRRTALVARAAHAAGAATGRRIRGGDTVQHRSTVVAVGFVRADARTVHLAELRDHLRRHRDHRALSQAT